MRTTQFKHSRNNLSHWSGNRLSLQLRTTRLLHPLGGGNTKTKIHLDLNYLLRAEVSVFYPRSRRHSA